MFVITSISIMAGFRSFWRRRGRGGTRKKEPPIKLHAGDVAVAKDGVKHWHGATADLWFSHLVITAGMAEWLEPVGDAVYAEIHNN